MRSVRFTRRVLRFTRRALRLTQPAQRLASPARRAAFAIGTVAILVLTFPGRAGWADISEPGAPGSLEAQIAQLANELVGAQAKVAQARLTQQQFTAQLAAINIRLVELNAQAGREATEAFKAGRARTFGLVLSSTSPQDALRRLTALHMFAQEQSIVLADLKRAVADAAAARTAINQQVAVAQNAAATLQVQENKLRAILNHATGGPSGVTIPAATASPASRTSSGGFASERCSVRPDPSDTTDGGCLTPRTLHMYNEVKKAGFNHYVHCWRQQSWGEHPLGRACDWAAAASGFAGAATGADYAYGCKLVGWFIANSDRLGVMYVIWYKQIWIAGEGWHRYTTEGGDPSGDHTNHVHVSII